MSTEGFSDKYRLCVQRTLPVSKACPPALPQSINQSIFQHDTKPITTFHHFRALTQQLLGDTMPWQFPGDASCNNTLFSVFLLQNVAPHSPAPSMHTPLPSSPRLASVQSFISSAFHLFDVTRSRDTFSRKLLYNRRHQRP